jgi:hypothetical protein
MGKLAQQLCKQSQVKCYAKGGAVHGDEKMDRALIKKAVKAEALTGKKAGGKVKSCCK